MSEAISSQRELMRDLYRTHKGDEAAICAAYAEAERNGRVARKRNSIRVSPESYAKALHRQGILKGWLL